MSFSDLFRTPAPNTAPVPNTKMPEPVKVTDPSVREAIQEAVKQVLAQQLQERQHHQEQVVIDSRGWTVERRGYKYLYAFVPASQTVSVEVMGQTVNLTLRGLDYTAITVPDGARLTAATPALVMMVWTNYLWITSKLG